MYKFYIKHEMLNLTLVQTQKNFFIISLKQFFAFSPTNIHGILHYKMFYLSQWGVQWSISHQVQFSFQFDATWRGKGSNLFEVT